MLHDELAAWLRLILTPGVGNGSARRLLTAFGLPSAVFQQAATALHHVLTPAQVQAMLTEPAELPPLLASTWQWLNSDAGRDDGVGRRILTLGDSAYPAGLLEMEDPPLMLYLTGRLDVPHADTALSDLAGHSIAMVGSRNPTPQGAANARQFASALAQTGLTVISGLALGIDGAAHQGALEGAAEPGAATANPWATVAVVGTGLDRVYPARHRELAHRIAKRGLLVSEYPLGTPPLAANFPKRNRLISSLSQGTLVVEAALKSGSLITARLASEQGKEVFAIPGSIHAAQSRGCHALIKQGAKLVESVQDVLEELRLADVPAQKNPDSIAFNDDSVLGFAENDEKNGLLTAMGYDPVGIDALLARTGLDTASLQAQLLELELDGFVARLPGGLFQRMASA